MQAAARAHPADRIGVLVNDLPASSATDAAAPAAAAAGARPAARGAAWAAAAAAVLALVALGLAWTTQQRVKLLESELVRRQHDSTDAANEARVLARQAESASRETAAKMALLEARVAETAMQRSQFEDLIQSLVRSRDENVLADIESAIRVAMQQTAITGSAEALVLALRQSDERLARYNQPRLERVRRAIAQDLDRVRNAAVTDIAVPTLRLDEIIRQIDELPLLSTPAAHTARAPAPPAAARTASAAAAASAPAARSWRAALDEAWTRFAERLWGEVKGLVRVTRIEHPEAMLLAPDQASYLRENLKLRLLNARLAMLSRQFDTAQSDLRDAHNALERYFDRSSRRTTAALEGLRQVAAQARSVSVPRPDATLAAITAAAAGR